MDAGAGVYVALGWWSLGTALHWAEKSIELAFDEADEADDDTLNRIVWHAMRGDQPYPEQWAGGDDD